MLLSLSTEFLARNHSALKLIDIVVGHGRSVVPLSSTRLCQQRSDSNFARGLVMQADTRDTLSCKDRNQPTGSHGHVSGPLVNVDMVHKFCRGYDSQDPIGYLDVNATVRDLKRVILLLPPYNLHCTPSYSTVPLCTSTVPPHTPMYPFTFHPTTFICL